MLNFITTKEPTYSRLFCCSFNMMKTISIFTILLIFNSLKLSAQSLTFINYLDEPSYSLVNKYKAQKGLVIIFLDPECPMCQKYTYTLTTLANKYSNPDMLNFIGIISGNAVEESVITQYAKHYKINFPIFVDTTYVLSDFLGAKITPEVFLLDSNSSIIYKGLIDNWYYSLGRKRSKPTEHYLEDNIKTVIEDKPLKYLSNDAIGCIIYK